MTIDVLTTVYIGNSLGIALLLVLFFSNIERFRDGKENKLVFKLLAVTMLSCIADPLVYTVDGHPGILNTIIIYAGNSWLYIGNIAMGFLWAYFLSQHIGIKISKARKSMYSILFLVGIICIVINIFKPIIFTVTDNVYQRTTLFWIYVTFAGIYILDSIIVYARASKRSGALKFFPIYVFIIPVIIGVIVQSMFYGISVIWASVAIALAGVMTALKNELIYTDTLTGLYNRFYLQQLSHNMRNRHNNFFTGIMADLNGFKSINDRFGHGEGDEALIIAARLFQSTIGEYGIVTRYAGDEFVMVLNTVDESEVNSIIEQIHQAFHEYNNTKEKPYKLSVSIGHSVLDLKNQTFNEFMNTIDLKMYENKREFYKNHDRRSQL